MINFEGRYDLTGSDAPVSFDIKGTGVPVLIGWTAAESDEAFLWLDRNGNGIVDGGRELFGTATRLHDGLLAPNGFEALRELDSNGDSFVDAGDAAMVAVEAVARRESQLASETNEISAVNGSRVARFDLDYRWEGRRDEHSNRFKYESRVWLMGATDLATSRRVYDLFFVGVTN